MRLRMDSHAQQLYQQLNAARLQSVASRTPVTICPSVDGNACDETWNSSYMIFNDRNRDRLRSDDEKQLQVINGKSDNQIKIRWSSFQKLPALQWRPTGMTAAQNGSFILCPKSGENKYARAVILTKTGRVRLSEDKNKDGIHENASGQPLSC